MTEDGEGDREARLVRLEENLAFQEMRLEKLDTVIRGLQKQLSEITRDMERTHDMLLHLRDIQLAQDYTARGSDPPPPHYQQEK